jgi:hypothetical protein
MPLSAAVDLQPFPLVLWYLPPLFFFGSSWLFCCIGGGQCKVVALALVVLLAADSDWHGELCEK